MDWIPKIRVKALDRRVLAVARTRIEGTWSAYIGAVPGIRHDDEVASVLSGGNKLSERIARAAFPCYGDIPYSQ